MEININNSSPAIIHQIKLILSFGFRILDLIRNWELPVPSEAEGEIRNFEMIKINNNKINSTSVAYKLTVPYSQYPYSSPALIIHLVCHGNIKTSRYNPYSIILFKYFILILSIIPAKAGAREQMEKHKQTIGFSYL